MISINLFVETKFIAYYLPIVVIFTTFILFFLFLFLVHYGLVFNFNSKASIFPSLSVLKFYLILLEVCSLIGVIDYSLKVYNTFFVESLASKLELKRALLTSKEQKGDNLSRNSSFNKNDLKRDSLGNQRRNSSAEMDGNNFRNKINESMWENSKIRIKKADEMNELYNLNSIKKKSGVLDDNKYYLSRVFQSSSSLSSSSNKRISISNVSNVSKPSNNYDNNMHYKNNKSFQRSSVDKKSKEYEITNNNINIITINKNTNKKNKISFLRKVDTNFNQNYNNINILQYRGNLNENNINHYNSNIIENNDNNHNIRTTDLMLNNDIRQYKIK